MILESVHQVPEGYVAQLVLKAIDRAVNEVQQTPSKVILNSVSRLNANGV